MKKLIILAIIFVSIITLNACSKEGGNSTNISSTGSQKSHNMGRNCMSCHKSGGEGEGWFNVAGTVYDSAQTNLLPNSTVFLYTAPNGGGTLNYTIQVDGKGNFYTTDAIDFGTTGLYPVVSGKSISKMMGSSITTGQCNSCHGVSTDRIWSK